MKLESVKSVDRLSVYKNNVLAGELTRTASGCEFRYDEGYREQANASAIAFSLPLRSTPFRTTGDNVPPFFAGLLPEGRRLEALIGSIKTSADDMFSILAAAGKETIGDVHVSIADADNSNDELQEPASISDTTFSELFAFSIGHQNLRWRDKDSAIAGVIPKLSSQLISFPVSLAKRNKRYILKLAPEKYPQLVENELFFMTLAKSCGIDVADVSVVTDKTGAKGLLVERFDRVYDKTLKKMTKVHQEDACQLLGRYPQDKYRLTMREIAEAIAKVSTSPEVEVSRLLELFLFSYFIANGDMHAKNISIVSDPESGRVRVSRGYDIVSTLPYGDQTMALSFEGKNKNLRRKEILAFAARAGIREAVTTSLIERIAESVLESRANISEIGLPHKNSSFLKKTIAERVGTIAG